MEEEEWGERGGRGRCLVRDTIFIKGGNNNDGLKNSTQYPFRPSGNDRVVDMYRVGKRRE